MLTREVTINNQVGLHARPATFFIQKANEFKSSIWIEKDDLAIILLKPDAALDFVCLL